MKIITYEVYGLNIYHLYLNIIYYSCGLS
ncbi:unnamed protein product [Spirodela intermedia]|uniref:Uncharacterized protein n=2 Tax=Spirodela intermedia TaxID=51605 RepID=A0ABN7ED44_SPIIN|nr:unnamed protein product [Spirodela intermedia]CAA7406837.1 unnamed protein product [Spirodela intermedia]